jgi:hypothetical protein
VLSSTLEVGGGEVTARLLIEGLEHWESILDLVGRECPILPGGGGGQTLH